MKYRFVAKELINDKNENWKDDCRNDIGGSVNWRENAASYKQSNAS